MADLPEVPNFDAGVYQLETTDAVVGGVDGKSNAAARNLANRTKYLKQHLDALEAEISMAAHLAAADPHPQYLLESDIVSQAEAEAGAAATARAWTAERVRQAVTALAGVLPLQALDYPTIATADNRLTVTPSSAAGTGGYVSIAAGAYVALAQEAVAGVSGRMLSWTTPGFQSANLDANSTYYVRAQVTGGVFTLYTTKGTDNDAIPASLKGTPNAAAGGGFDSTRLDMLVAKVVTGTAGSVPAVTALANAARLFVELVITHTMTSTANNTTRIETTALSSINVARKPRFLFTFLGVGNLSGAVANTDINEGLFGSDAHTESRYAVSVTCQWFNTTGAAASPDIAFKVIGVC